MKAFGIWAVVSLALILTPEQIQESVQDVVHSYFKAIERLDYTGMKSLSTEDFLLFENGTIMNNDDLFHMLEQDTTVRIRYKLEFIRTNMSNGLCLVVYKNKGSFYKGELLIKEVSWLENAAVVKIKGHWKLSFLHSTRVN